MTPERAYQLSAWTVVAAISGSCIFLQLPQFQWFSDYWEHTAAIKALALNLASPSNPHFATSDSDRQFIPHFVMLAALVRFLHLPLFTAFGLLGALTSALLVFSLGHFAREYFRDPWAPSVTLLVFLACWGTPWVWTGFYEFRALFYNIYYPSTLALALTFVAWSIVINILRSTTTSMLRFISLTVLLTIIFITHQLGGIFAAGSIALFAIFEREGSPIARAGIGASVTVGLALAWFWPYFNPILLTIHGSKDAGNEGAVEFYRFMPVLLMMGPSVLGIPAVLNAVRVDRNLTLAVGFVAIFAAYLAGGLLGSPVTHRLLAYSIVYLHLGIVREILRYRSWTISPRLKHRVIFAGIGWILIQVGFASVDFSRFAFESLTHRSFGSFPNQPVVQTMKRLTASVDETAIVFASKGPALVLPSFKGKVIARPRPELMIADGMQRDADNALFFSARATASDRQRLIAKYGATHVAFVRQEVSPLALVGIRALGAIEADVNDVYLIRLKQEQQPIAH
jgi:hypothetical protein